MCGEDKPLSEYYVVKSGKKAGQRKGAKCKPCYIKVQNERDKVSEAKKAYVEKNKDKIREYNYNRFLAVKDTKEFKEKRREYDKRHRSTDDYKDNAHIRADQSKKNRESKKNHHLIAINKELLKARVRDKHRRIEIEKLQYYKSIANKYNNPIEQPIKEWADIKGYEGLYQISNYGQVYSCIRDRGLEQMITDDGYMRVTLYKGDDGKKVKVHRLVANAFNPNIHNKPEVNHIDSNRENNISSNLEWTTRQENADHRVCKRMKLI